MGPIPGPKRYGGTTSANDFNRLRSTVYESMNVLGGGDIEFIPTTGGSTLLDNRPPNFFAVITDSNGTNYYSFASCTETAVRGALEETGDAEFYKRTGEYDGIPACEVNGRTDVPIGQRVRLFAYADGSGFGFVYDGEPAYGYYASGESIGQGTVEHPIYRYSCEGSSLIETRYTIRITLINGELSGVIF